MTPAASGLVVLQTAQEQEWKGVLAQMAQHDFYHLAEYHRLEEARGEGTAHLFTYREGESMAALPLLLRPVDAAEPAGWQDATSVYGYGGVVASHSTLPENFVRNFHAALRDALTERRVIAAFSRLHPLLPQSELLAGLGECRLYGQTVSIDLTLSPETQRAQFRLSHKRRIKKLLHAGLVCGRDEQKRHLPEFVSLYHETMRRVQAQPSYLFAADYFSKLADELGDRLQLFVVLAGDQVTSGALFTHCDGIIQYHLGGTRDRYLNLSPMPLIIDTARLWGHAVGARVLHLGGGVGSRGDSLFHFKAGFSHCRHDFGTWRWVVAPEIYRELCEKRRRLAPLDDLEMASPDFFPTYRCPVPQPAMVAGTRAANSVECPMTL